MPKFRMKKEWWLAIRLIHWSMVSSVFILLVTGFYIAYPISFGAGITADKFSVGNTRTLHTFFGVFLTFLMLWRAYLGLFAKFHARWSDLLAWTNIHNLINQAKFYLLISNNKPKHEYQYAPLQALAYSGLILLQFAIIMTGLIMVGANYHAGLSAFAGNLLKPIEIALGGLAGVRLIHHIVSWGFIIFIMAHVYMAIWTDVVYKEGTISSMISGRVFRKAN
ncbi:MAG: Ni/Fe-hydrogenase, b-type cytochrome subunit [Pseudomonadota bacterium]|nr:Ni/Fe-hydrogenase, b-type cytochrome subunit [Pseudomonadota bacterium]